MISPCRSFLFNLIDYLAIPGILDITLFHTRGMRIRWIGSITTHLNIRVGSNATNASPNIIDNHNVSRHRFKTSMMIKLAGRTVFQVIFSLLYKKIPNTSPVSIAVTVNPGKNTPDGNMSIPNISPIAYPIAAHIGPYIIPIMATGRKPKPIRSIGVFMEQNLVRIISKAIRNAITTNLVVADLLSIKKLLSQIVVGQTTLLSKKYIRLAAQV